MRIVSGLLIAAFCASGTAFAQSAARTDAPVKDKMVCKRDRYSYTGSHLSAPKTCLKASEWKEREADKDRFFQALNDRIRVTDPDPAGPAPQ